LGAVEGVAVDVMSVKFSMVCGSAYLSLDEESVHWFAK